MKDKVLRLSNHNLKDLGNVVSVSVSQMLKIFFWVGLLEMIVLSPTGLRGRNVRRREVRFDCHNCWGKLDIEYFFLIDATLFRVYNLTPLRLPYCTLTPTSLYKLNKSITSIFLNTLHPDTFNVYISSATWTFSTLLPKSSPKNHPCLDCRLSTHTK